jgi:hypothetical protein
MCDYSLQGLPNRLADKGEELKVHRFSTGAIGFTSAVEMQSIAGVREVQKKSNFWSSIIDWFRFESKPSAPVICIPPGARMVLQDIPSRLQNELGVGPKEEVTFTQVTAQPYNYRDAVRFKNGREVLLQKLEPGQCAVVLSLTLEEVSEPEIPFLAFR